MNVTLNSNNQLEKVETRAGDKVTETKYSEYKNLDEIQSDVLFP